MTVSRVNLERWLARHFCLGVETGRDPSLHRRPERVLFRGNASKPQCRGGMHAVSDLCEKFPTDAGDGPRPVSTSPPRTGNNS